MSSAALKTENFLAARDQRQARIDRALQRPLSWAATLSLSIPGADKCPPGALELFQWGMNQLGRQLQSMKMLHREHDLLGPWLLLTGDDQAIAAKRLGIELEEALPAARLLDFDVYLPQDVSLNRTTLGFAERSCLLCSCPARECVRLKRHHHEEIIRASHDLIACFKPA
jgi:holo-ACP synthase CitX